MTAVQCAAACILCSRLTTLHAHYQLFIARSYTLSIFSASFCLGCLLLFCLLLLCCLFECTYSTAVLRRILYPNVTTSSRMCARLAVVHALMYIGSLISMTKAIIRMTIHRLSQTA
eukprot:20726-Heterococcus_DN1.PRE.1